MTKDKWAEYREAEVRWLRKGGFKTEQEMTALPKTPWATKEKKDKLAARNSKRPRNRRSS